MALSVLLIRAWRQVSEGEKNKAFIRSPQYRSQLLSRVIWMGSGTVSLPTLRLDGMCDSN